MKILMIHNEYSKYSGEEAVVEMQIQLLKENGHQVITYFRSSKELELMSMGKIKAFFTALYNPSTIHDLKKIIHKENPDLVHIHNLYPLISPAILAMIKKMGIPIVMTVHNYRLLCPNGLFFSNGAICEKCTSGNKELNCITNNCEDSLFKSIGYALRNYWARKSKYYIDNIDKFLCLTKFQKNKLIANGYPAAKCEVIPNIYNKKIKKIDYNIQSRNYIAFAGRISPEKGIPLLLEAAKRLPDIPFKLAGGARSGYMDELDIPKNVTFLGMLDSKELSLFYQKARFFVLSSIWYEGFPMVFPEAMAHKLPIIAPNMAGFSEVSEENINGLLFEPNNVDSLVKTIEKLWKNHELSKEMAHNNFEKVNNIYNSKVYYEHLKINYEQLVCKK